MHGRCGGEAEVVFAGRALHEHLQGMSDREAPPALDGHEVARSTMLLVATDDGVDPAYAVCRRAGLEVARREGAAVVLYDRSSESYLVDPYESGPWTSQNHGPAGKTLLTPNELIRLGHAPFFFCTDRPDDE